MTKNLRDVFYFVLIVIKHSNITLPQSIGNFFSTSKQRETERQLLIMPNHRDVPNPMFRYLLHQLLRLKFKYYVSLLTTQRLSKTKKERKKELRETTTNPPPNYITLSRALFFQTEFVAAKVGRARNA
jgi:hypothetical protein